MHLKRRYKLNEDSEHSKHGCRINLLNFLFEKKAIKETEITDGDQTEMAFESYMFIPRPKNGEDILLADKIEYRSATPKEFIGGKNSIHINDEVGMLPKSPEEVMKFWNEQGVLFYPPENDGWVSVDDKLPENDDEVLAFWIGWDDM